jgi:hypothetical protein
MIRYRNFCILQNHVKHVVMTREKSVVGLWGDRKRSAEGHENAADVVVDIDAYDTDEEIPERSIAWGERIGITCLLYTSPSPRDA